MNRSKKVFKNIVWELGYYLAVIAFGFLAPRFIILVYGSEINGLSSTITQIINIILLLQSGATTAAVFSLYKPIAEKNMEEINSIVGSTTRYFQRLSCTFFILMLLTAIITSRVIQSSINRNLIFSAFFIMGLKSFLDLLITSKYRVVFTAFEQKFYISIGTLVEQIVYYLLVFGTIYLKLHFLWMHFWFLFGCIIKVVYLTVVYKKEHPEIKITRENSRRKITGMDYAMANEVSHSIVASSITIILSFMYGLEETSVYSVYALVCTALSLVTTAIYSAFAPSFGNIVAQKDIEKTKKTFQIFQFIFIALNEVLLMCMLYLLVPFVKIYTHGATDFNYINTTLSYLLALFGMFSALRVPYNIVVSTFGFFKQTWIQPVISALFSILLSYIMGQYDYSLIMVGPIAFYIINYLYQHFKLSKLVPYLISAESFALCLSSLFGLTIALIASIYIRVPEGIFSWLYFSVISFTCACVYVLFSSFLFTNKLLRESVDYVFTMLSRR
jgi:O-antigen/teichoic acid export membrane protein